MTEKELYFFLSDLKNETSINEKVRMLMEHKDSKELRDFFYYALGKQKYGIKQIPECAFSGNLKSDFYGGISILDKLASREITGNKAIKIVKDYLENCSKYLFSIFVRMLQKFPDVGISQTLCNRIWDNMFPNEIKLCKAQVYSIKALQEIHYPAISQRKCDGARCLAFVDENGYATFYTSSGKEYKNLEALRNDFKALFDTGNYSVGVFDGEMLVVENGKVLSRKEGNGILNKSIHNTITNEEANCVTMVIWDYIPQSDYDNGKGKVKYSEIMKKLQVNLPHISTVESKIVNSKEEAFEHFKEMLSRGEEGTILKNLDMCWEGKRSKNCVKFKIIIENTLKIVDFIEGSGKYLDNLGALICESSDRKVRVKIGSGLSDSLRNKIWRNKEKYTGKMAEILSNGIIQAENGTYSLFLPRFLEIRIDKTEADSFDMIKSLSDGSEMLKKI